MATVSKNKRHIWPIRMIGVLLVVQAFWLLGISVGNVARFGLSLIGAIVSGTLAPEQIEAVFVSLPLAALAILAVVGAISFFFLLSFGWLTAMIVQGLTLFDCLALYFQGKPAFIYPIMLYCIVMVLYLNSFDVQMAFRSRRPQK